MRVLDGDGVELPPGGAALEGAVVLDLSGLDPGLADVEVTVACDVGFAALAVLDATLRPGIELLLELTGFDSALARASLVVTGEGSLDTQTLHGKAPAGVAAAAAAAGVPVVAVCGRLGLDPGQLAAAGFAAAYPLTGESDDLVECLERPGPLLERVGVRIAREQLG